MFIDCYCLAKPRMVEINATKSTLVAKKIAISYSNEDDFLVINNVIQILSLLKINATFEKIDIHHDNYLKNIKTGISEENLTFLKKNDIFIHTPFDMKYFCRCRYRNWLRCEADCGLCLQELSEGMLIEDCFAKFELNLII